MSTEADSSTTINISSASARRRRRLMTGAAVGSFIAAACFAFAWFAHAFSFENTDYRAFDAKIGAPLGAAAVGFIALAITALVIRRKVGKTSADKIFWALSVALFVIGILIPTGAIYRSHRIAHPDDSLAQTQTAFDFTRVKGAKLILNKKTIWNHLDVPANQNVWGFKGSPSQACDAVKATAPKSVVTYTGGATALPSDPICRFDGNVNGHHVDIVVLDAKVGSDGYLHNVALSADQRSPYDQLLNVWVSA